MKYKSKLFLCIIILFLLQNKLNILGQDSLPNLNINARSAILIEPNSGKILLDLNSHDKLAPASVTKIMTILLIYDAISEKKINWDDIVTVSTHASSMGGSQIYLEPMEKQTVRDLTKSIIIASANDSAVAMSEFIAGSEDAFVELMNKRAKTLDMKNTNFMNACGLDEANHFTSAYDIALMSKELVLKYPEVLEISKIWQDSIVHKTSRGEQEFGLTNTNKIIKTYEGATGLKTGSTSEALYCLSATATRNGMDLISVILGAPNPVIRFEEVIKMLDFGFNNYRISQGEDAGTLVGKIKVLKGEDLFVPLEIKNKITVLLSKDNTKNIETKIELLQALNAPIQKGTKAGEIIYMIGDLEVGRSDLVTVCDVKVASLFKIMHNLIQNWLS